MKKEYIEPQVRFIKIETQPLMAGTIFNDEAVEQLSKEDEEFGW